MKRVVLVVMVGLGLTVHAGLLWEIGEADDSGAEFALAPGGYGDFKEDGYYGVGHSAPGRDWPYVHPGPSDVWAGGRPHTFRIVFAVPETPADGTCVVHFDLLDTQTLPFCETSMSQMLGFFATSEARRAPKRPRRAEPPAMATCLASKLPGPRSVFALPGPSRVTTSPPFRASFALSGRVLPGG